MNPYETVLNPVFTTEEERIKFIESMTMKFDTFKKWNEEIYKNHNTFIELAKYFISENWQKVDWTDFEIQIGKTCFGKKRKLESSDKWMAKIWAKLDAKITEFDKLTFTYDYSDGDLSVEINGQWKFLEDAEVIDAVLYLEKRL